MENGITPSLHGVKEIDQIIFAQSLKAVAGIDEQYYYSFFVDLLCISNSETEFLCIVSMPGHVALQHGDKLPTVLIQHARF